MRESKAKEHLRGMLAEMQKARSIQSENGGDAERWLGFGSRQHDWLYGSKGDQTLLKLSEAAEETRSLGAGEFANFVWLYWFIDDQLGVLSVENISQGSPEMPSLEEVILIQKQGWEK